MAIDMKVTILAAGLGTRLREIMGEDIPKVMVPVGGKPLLLRTIEQLKAQGFKEFYLNLHYLPHVVTNYFGDGSRFGVSMQYSFEPELLESAGAVKKMESWFTNETDFLLLYGDVFHNLDFRPIVDFHKKNHAFGTVVVKETIHVPQSDLVEVDPTTKKIIAIHVRPHSLTELKPGLFATAGLGVWSRDILDFIPKDRSVHLEKETMPFLLGEGKALYAWPISKEKGDVVVDIGKPDNYYKVQAIFSGDSVRVVQ